MLTLVASDAQLILRNIARSVAITPSPSTIDPLSINLKIYQNVIMVAWIESKQDEHFPLPQGGHKKIVIKCAFLLTQAVKGYHGNFVVIYRLMSTEHCTHDKEP